MRHRRCTDLLLLPLPIILLLPLWGKNHTKFDDFGLSLIPDQIGESSNRQPQAQNILKQTTIGIPTDIQVKARAP